MRRSPCNGRRRLHAPTSPLTVGAGFHARPAWDEGQRDCARKKWCAGCARGISYVGRWTRGGRTVGGVGALGHAQRLHPTYPGGHTAQGASRTPPPTVGARHTPRRIWQCVRFVRATQMVRGRCPRDCICWAVDRGWRTVGDAGAFGHAGHPRQRCLGGHVTMVHRGRCTLQAAAKPALRHMAQREWKLYPNCPPTPRLR